jgi:hypothetical protein
MPPLPSILFRAATRLHALARPQPKTKPPPRQHPQRESMRTRLLRKVRLSGLCVVYFGEEDASVSRTPEAAQGASPADDRHA